jgi:acyl-coenzyme A thioesterase PaaI-like protein
MNLWPPFLVNGVHVTRISEDWSELTVRLRLHFWNRNYVGTHFGGNLFAMADPMWMLMAMNRMGRQYYVWDKAAEIEFVAPAREDVFACFSLDSATVEELRAQAADGSRVLRWFDVELKSAAGEVVARVRKQLYVRLKPDRRPANNAAQPTTPTETSTNRR